MPPETATPSLIQQDLYFEQITDNGKEVSPAEFQAFIDNTITPRFPAGLTTFDVNNQPDDTKLVSLFVEDTLASQAAVKEIIAAYQQQFPKTDVLQVTNEDSLKVGFGVGEDLIHNNKIPELIQVDLFLGRNIAGVSEVSPAEFQAFIDNVVTPRFPAGLTVLAADGQFQASTGTIIKEPANVISLILEDTEQNETYINEIVTEYIEQFQQESVLQAVNEDVTVSFGASGDLINNDPVPELIQADLFFGRSIAGVGEVSTTEFQTFLDDFVTPYFPELAVFDANGQFQDSTGTIIEEPTQVVSIVFADTEQNEAYINSIVTEYIEQFQQESVLTVVDEDIQTNFTSGDYNKITANCEWQQLLASPL